MKQSTTNTYPSFAYEAKELSAFIYSFDTFTISLKNKLVIHFTPDDVTAFREWLLAHKVREVQYKTRGT